MQSTETDQKTRRDLDDLIDRAETIAGQGVQKDDGYTYRVPAPHLVASQNTIRELLAALAAERDRSDRAEARLAEAWDEGVKWAAIECGAIERPENIFHLPEENPYRSEATA